MSIEAIIEEKIKEILGRYRAEEYLSLRQVSEEFGCSRTWVHRQHVNGNLKIYRFGGKVRIKRSELEAIGIAL